MSIWPRLTAPVDPLETWRTYQAQSANTRGGVVPEPESAYAIKAWKERAQDLRGRFEDRVSAQTYAQGESEQEPITDYTQRRG